MERFRLALVGLTMVTVTLCLAFCAPYHTTGLANLASLLALFNYTFHGENV